MLVKSFKWKIYCGPKFVEAGTIEAESERDGIREVMVMKGQMDADKSYSVTVGDTMMSAYGDEFERSASVAGWGEHDEKSQLDGGHLFQPKVSDIAGSDIAKAMDNAVKSVARRAIQNAVENLGESAKKAGAATKDLGDVVRGIATCQKYMDGKHRLCSVRNAPCTQECACGHVEHEHNMSGVKRSPITGGEHSQCSRCGFVDPQGLGQPSPPGRGTDQIIGVAQESRKKGDIVYVKLNSGAQIAAKCGEDIAINERLRMSVSGVVYPPAPDGTGGVVYPHKCAYDDLKDAQITITNGYWSDPFTADQAATIKKIVTLQGLDPLLIKSSIQKDYGWKFICSDGRYMVISDQMIHTFKG